MLKRSVLVAMIGWATLAPAWPKPNPPAPPPPSQHAAAPEQFHRLAASFIEDYLTVNPEGATSLGDHRFDGEWSDLSPTGLNQARRLYTRTLEDLRRIPPASLSPEDRIDAEILRTNLESSLFTLDELKEYEWNPLLYNPGPGLFALIARDYAPLEVRLKSLERRLRTVGKLLEAARANLKHPPRIHCETAITQNKGVIAWLKADLEGQTKAGPAAASLLESREVAIKALESYGEWLEKELLPRSTGNFRIGPTLYGKKLAYTLESDLGPAEILKRAQAELRQTHAEMTTVARSLYPELLGKAPDGLSDRQVCQAVLDRLAEDRPSNKTILKQAREDLARCTQFVRDHHLVTLPTETCQVIEMPEFNRGVAVAYCDSPGPLEKKGETFYAISPTPADWSPQRVESFYREYNFAMLEDLTAHEAVPGHFLQLMHANRFKAPTQLRAVFQSGTLVEGWATYGEQVMATHGYGGRPYRMEQLKMRLRLILNAILDQRVHAESLSEEEAVKFLTEQGFQEEGEAVGKWRRACLTSAQLSTYFVGNCEVNELCRDYQAQHPALSIQELHDRVLSFGSPAPRYIRRLLGLK